MEIAKLPGCEKKTRAPRTLYFKLKAWSVYNIVSMTAEKMLMSKEFSKKISIY